MTIETEVTAIRPTTSTPIDSCRQEGGLYANFVPIDRSRRKAPEDRRPVAPAQMSHWKLAPIRQMHEHSYGPQITRRGVDKAQPRAPSIPQAEEPPSSTQQ